MHIGSWYSTTAVLFIGQFTLQCVIISCLSLWTTLRRPSCSYISLIVLYSIEGRWRCGLAIANYGHLVLISHWCPFCMMSANQLVHAFFQLTFPLQCLLSVSYIVSVVSTAFHGTELAPSKLSAPLFCVLVCFSNFYFLTSSSTFTLTVIVYCRLFSAFVLVWLMLHSVLCSIMLFN